MRTSGALAGAAVVLLLLQPSAVSAAPAPLCEPDVSRGAVPEVFAVHACVDATSVTLRNTLDVPVVVRPTGDLGSAVRVRNGGGEAAEVTRLVDGTHDVLVPGDIARWPLGAGAAAVTVTGLDPAMIPAVVESLRVFPPRPGDDEVQTTANRGFAALVRSVAAAVEERTSCLEDKNFLRMAACDAAAAGRIGRAVSMQLSRSDATDVAPVVLDPERWDDWASVRPAAVGPSAERTLRLASSPPPALVRPPVVPPAAPPAAVLVPAPAPAQASAPWPAPGPLLPAVPSPPRWPTWEDLPDRDDGADGDRDGNGNGRNDDDDNENDDDDDRVKDNDRDDNDRDDNDRDDNDRDKDRGKDKEESDDNGRGRGDD